MFYYNILAYTTKREIEIIYPEKDHTFLPSDGALGMLRRTYENTLNYQRLNIIKMVFSEIGDIKIIKEDFDFFQIKKNFPNKINKNHLFKISKVRRINFTGRKITYSNTYEVPVTEVKLTEKDLEIGQLDKSSYLNTVSPEKQSDVSKLLKAMGIHENASIKAEYFLER